METDSGLTMMELLCENRLFRIYKARRGTKVVILKAAASPDAMTRELLRREYELGCNISHPCVVRTLDFADDTPVGPAIILEYIEGLTLDEFLKGDICSRQKLSILGDILDGTDCLHHHGILHNDLKPGNIIVNSFGAARIIDFGLSGSDDSIFKGSFGGSAGYSAPEILDGRGPSGAASDIFSLGMLLSDLFPGRKFRHIAKRCTRAVPAERYGSVAALRRAVTFRRRLPVAVAMILLAIASTCWLCRLEADKQRRDQAVTTFEKQQSAAEKSLQESFDRALADMKRQKYYEFAALVKNKYLMDYMACESQTPDAEKLALQSILAGQSKILDSILTSLPSISTLPSEEQAPLMEKFSRREIE